MTRYIKLPDQWLDVLSFCLIPSLMHMSKFVFSTGATGWRAQRILYSNVWQKRMAADNWRSTTMGLAAFLPNCFWTSVSSLLPPAAFSFRWTSEFIRALLSLPAPRLLRKLLNHLRKISHNANHVMNNEPGPLCHWIINNEPGPLCHWIMKYAGDLGLPSAHGHEKLKWAERSKLKTKKGWYEDQHLWLSHQNQPHVP